MNAKQHWDDVYQRGHADALSWFQPQARQSLQLVRDSGVAADAGIIDSSGLPVQLYSPDALHAEFGAPCELLRHEAEDHHTPRGAVQKFIYCWCRKRPN